MDVEVQRVLDEAHFWGVTIFLWGLLGLHPVSDVLFKLDFLAGRRSVNRVNRESSDEVGELGMGGTIRGERVTGRPVTDFLLIELEFLIHRVLSGGQGGNIDAGSVFEWFADRGRDEVCEEEAKPHRSVLKDMRVSRTVMDSVFSKSCVWR